MISARAVIPSDLRISRRNCRSSEPRARSEQQSPRVSAPRMTMAMLQCSSRCASDRTPLLCPNSLGYLCYLRTTPLIDPGSMPEDNTGIKAPYGNQIELMAQDGEGGPPGLGLQKSSALACANSVPSMSLQRVRRREFATARTLVCGNAKREFQHILQALLHQMIISLLSRDPNKSSSWEHDSPIH